MTALPPLTLISEDLGTSVTKQRAYDLCLSFERTVQHIPPNSGPSEQVCIRILGYIILHGPEEIARVNIAKEVVSCATDEDVVTLGKFYYDHFLRAYKANKGTTPPPSNQISPPSFDSLKAMIKDMLVEATSEHRAALIRDGFCCVVTGRPDAACIEKSSELQEDLENRGRRATFTQCAYIFPESTNFNISGQNEVGAKRDYAASVWAVMDRFGYTSAWHDLSIHRLENVMTMEPDIHSAFDSLRMWFEATDTPNCYKLCATKPFYLADLPTHVTFKAAEGVDEKQVA